MGAKVEASQSKSDTQSSKDANYFKETTFDPRADSVIANLAGGLSNNNTANADNAANYYNSLLKQPAGANPYAQQVVDTQNKLSDADFQKRLAGVRSSGYGGGIGRDLVDQGMFTSDFTNRQASWNAQTLLDSFKTDQNQRMDSAGALANIDNAKYATAINFINSLRGEKGTSAEDATSKSKTSSLSAGVSAKI